MKKSNEQQLGFTMIELLTVMGIMAILLGISSFNVLNLSTTVSSESSINVLISDIKTQQVKSMIGDTEGRGTPDAYGIIIQGDQYILFHGDNYLPSDTTNFTIPAEEGYTLSTTFANNTIIFASRSGEIINFNDSQNTIISTYESTGKFQTFELNRLGVITEVN